MAIINCNECGEKISDRATVCPHCGCPLTYSSEGEIYFHWYGRPGDSIHKTIIHLDGKEASILKCGDYFKCKISDGIHIVELFQGKHLLLSDRVEISSTNRNVVFSFKETPGFSHAKLKRIVDQNLHENVQDKFNNIPRCPTCGSKEIKKISTPRKAISINMIGLASSSIGKTFMCKNCGYKW